MPARLVACAGALLAGLAASVLVVAPSVANPAPVPELNAPGPILPPRPCAYEGDDRYEKRLYRLEGWRGPDFKRYPGACERLRFAYGPIFVKPGQNDVLVEPVTIQKPLRDGYMTRFKPDLVLANGTVPPVERVHLHHGTWLSVPSYGSGPFMAAGEEKTIGSIPKGYGMPIMGSDQWQLLYMVHSAVPEPMVVYITYEIDFIPKRKAERLGIKPVYPLWLDVRPSGYPVFNVQRRFGGADGECTWPKERCAAFDPWGREVVGQGMPGNGTGTDLTLPARGEPLGRIREFTGGTIIAIGGHLHPGGLTDEIDLVRRGRATRIFTSEGVYWNRNNHNRPGGPPTSWDVSLTGTGLPYWGVHVQPGDKLRINATYDTTRQATYENMGIAIAGLVPDGRDGRPQAPGLNPFRAPRDRSRTCLSLERRLLGSIAAARDVGLRARRPKLCEWGIVTHGHQEANGNYGGPDGRWRAPTAGETNQVNIANFQYMPGDLSRVSSDGVPTVELGQTLRFSNLEGAAVYHTITTCRFPCLGPTGAAFPIGNGSTSLGRQVDLDSSEVGLGVPYIGPTSQRLNWRLPVTRERGFRPGETVTYYCRIHPFMRGAFKVTR
jgi:hypothetical protein